MCVTQSNSASVQSRGPKQRRRGASCGLLGRQFAALLGLVQLCVFEPRRHTQSQPDIIINQTGKSVVSSSPLRIPNTSQSLSSLSSESLLDSDDESPQSESLSLSFRANLEYAMLIRTRKRPGGWIKTERERRVFRSLKWESEMGEKKRKVYSG